MLSAFNYWPHPGQVNYCGLGWTEKFPESPLSWWKGRAFPAGDAEEILNELASWLLQQNTQGLDGWNHRLLAAVCLHSTWQSAFYYFAVMQKHRILKLRNIDHCVTMDTQQKCIIFKNPFKYERIAYFVLKMCGSFFYLESAVVLLNIHYLEVKIILILTINIIKNRFFFQPRTTECKQEGTWKRTLMAEHVGERRGRVAAWPQGLYSQPLMLSWQSCAFL